MKAFIYYSCVFISQLLWCNIYLLFVDTYIICVVCGDSLMSQLSKKAGHTACCDIYYSTTLQILLTTTSIINILLYIMIYLDTSSCLVVRLSIV
jgi:hypothetical protein